MTRYLYDREDIVAEYDGANALQAAYIHGPGMDMPLEMKRGGASYFYRRDGLGSVTGLVDSAGVKVRSYRYDAFGNILEEAGDLPNPYTFTGREHDPETGLLYYRARYYDPQFGRFLSEDPIGFASGDPNFYAYVGNNPVNWGDPLGLKILVCTRKVKGFPFIGNHAYAWDTTTNSAEGMRGSSGSGLDSDEKGRLGGDECYDVKSSKDREKGIMDFMRANQNNGIWFPFINDCHNATQDAVKGAGLEYPGAPGGRFGVLQ